MAMMAMMAMMAPQESVSSQNSHLPPIVAALSARGRDSIIGEAADKYFSVFRQIHFKM